MMIKKGKGDVESLALKLRKFFLFLPETKSQIQETSYKYYKLFPRIITFVKKIKK